MPSSLWQVRVVPVQANFLTRKNVFVGKLHFRLVPELEVLILNYIFKYLFLDAIDIRGYINIRDSKHLVQIKIF